MTTRKTTRAERKVMFLVRSLGIGGAERQLVELAIGLRHAGWDASVAVFYPGGVLQRELEDGGVPVFDLQKRGRWDVAGFLSRLVSLVRREQPQIVYGLLNVPNVLLAMLRPLLGEVRCVWGIAASDMDLSAYDWLAHVEFRLGVALSSCADLIVSNSNAGAAYHAKRGYRSERLIVIPNGIDVSRFRPDAEARIAVRSEWGVQADEKVFGIVARLDPVKDHPNFLRAAAAVVAEYPKSKFVCVGDGPAAYRAELVALAQELGLGARVIWERGRNEIWRVYNGLDVAVSASSSEGLPNAVAEAMATGVACVATDAGDCAHLVRDLGWICPPRDSAALASAMAAAAETGADSHATRQRIVSDYSVPALVERTSRELSTLLNNGSEKCSIAAAR